MTVSEIRERVAVIAKTANDDNETAHAQEDTLYADVLRAIADGADDPAALAEAALKAIDLAYDRWYA